MRSKPFALSCALTAIAVGVLGCSAPSDETGGSGDKKSEGPVTITYWSGSSNIEKLVDQWNAENPNIQVKWTEPAGGAVEIASKLLTANRGGDSPDVADVPTQNLPSLVLGEVARDITEYADDISDAYSDEVWAMNTFNGAVHGLQQDLAPMMLMYREDRFAELGIEVPKTWDEYAAVAKQVREKDPKSYLSAFDPAVFHFFAGVASQAGAKWWSLDGDTWTVGIADEPTLEVAAFWDKMIADDLVLVSKVGQPDWNKAINDGTILAFPAAVWAAGTLKGVAPDTAGKWRGALIPAWPGDGGRTGQMGGSSAIVTTSSDLPEQAFEFVSWLNASKEGSTALGKIAKFPGALAGQDSLSAPPDLMAGQDDFFEVAKTAAGNLAPITWGPNAVVAVGSFGDEMNKAVAAGEPMANALKKVEETTIDNLETTGFTVKRR